MFHQFLRLFGKFGYERPVVTLMQREDFRQRLANLENPAPGHIVATINVNTYGAPRMQALADELDVAYEEKFLSELPYRDSYVVTLVGKKENVQKFIQNIDPSMRR